MTTDRIALHGPRPLRGRCRLPGEKGMSHRALLFAALADGTTRLRDLAPGDDVGRTVSALRALGVGIESSGADVEITGRTVAALVPPSGEIDCGNSGTTMRMLAGLLAGRPFASVLTGDESLRRRPMARVVAPLRELGASISGPDDGAHAPLEIAGTELHGARVELGVASGQVKTALVLAGLQATGTTEIVEPATSRDHTERMLAALEAPVTKVDERTVRVSPGAPRAFTATLPGDPSSAAFLTVGAVVTPGSDLVVEGVLVNPGRIAFVDALREMGADVDVQVTGDAVGEPVGDISVRSSPLHGTVVDCTEPMIDEVPALAVAASFAMGTTELRGVGELRVKESDRVATVIDLVSSLGAEAEAHADVLAVHGGTPGPGALRSHGDHRIALAGAIAANAVSGTTTIDGWSAVDVSYPGFLADLEQLTGH